jgi:hypothetical protein
MTGSVYTTESLGPTDPRFVTRVPGVREIDHLFAVPASVGRGTLGVEGGVSIVAGPGMGKTSLLNRLARVLDEQRGFAAAIVRAPDIDRYRDDEGFYPYLGALLACIEGALPKSIDVAAMTGGRTRSSDIDEVSEGATPRLFEERIKAIGAAASRATGLCLLFDDLDAIVDAPWKQAFVAALRFTFQSCPGITPVYAVWLLFRDESLAGSNYFRNVTHPVFLSPLARSESAEGGGRSALVRLGLPGASPEDLARISHLGGGHPQLLHRLCADVVASGWRTGHAVPTDGRFDARAIDQQRALVRALLAGSPGLGEALRELDHRAPARATAYRDLPKGLIASGLVDEGDGGEARIPERVRDCF